MKMYNQLLHNIDITLTEKFDNNEVDYNYYLLKKCYAAIEKLYIEHRQYCQVLAKVYKINNILDDIDDILEGSEENENSN